MPFNFTVAQLKAIDARGNILVSAAAGSGKTSVLTERVIKKLTDENNRTPADKLLIVTFTNAAALEMRTRIENRLFDECAKYPDKKYLLEQKHLLNSADICTIDSFCINLVRENFDKCLIEQDFRVTNGSDMSSYENDILTEIIDNKLHSKDENLFKLLELVGYETDDTNLRDIVKKLYKHSVNLPFSGRFFDNLSKPYFEPFEAGHIWYEKIFEIAGSLIENIENSVKFMESIICNFGAQSEKAEQEINFYYDYCSRLKEELSSHNFDKLREVSFDFAYKAPSLSSQLPNVNTYKSGRQVIKNQIKKLQTYFTYSCDEINYVNAKYKDAVKLLGNIAKEYSDKVFELYKNNNCLAFHHTEQLALKLLCEQDIDGKVILTETAKEYFSRYDEVLVDEYQDVNDLQEMLFSILSNNQKNLFVVGDIKQSIYGFRGSQLKNFMNKKNSYIDYDFAKEDDAKKIILAENFRSRKSVCDFVNFVFSKLMTEKTGDISYGKEEVLNYSAKFDTALDTPTELIVVNNQSDSDEDYEIEANAIADYVTRLVNSVDSRFSYGDICILFEGIKKASVLSKIFNSKGIPISFVKEEYHKTAEISLVLSLLAVIDNPLHDIELLTVMMSPLFNFSADDVAIIRKGSKKGELYRAVLKSAQNGNTKSIEMLNKLKELRNKMIVSSLGSFLVNLIYDTEIFAVISSLDNSKHRQKNLEALISLAENYYDSAPNEFIKYVKRISEDGYGISETNENTVTVMTMHKSKGLQFPVVILSDLSKKINKQDARSVCVFTDDLGVGFKYFDEDEFRYHETVSKQIISNKILEEEVKERIRLLYVAMTRAEEKLVLVTSTNKNCSLKNISENIIDGEISADYIKNANSLAHFILSACLIHPDADCLRDLVENKPIASNTTNSKLNVSFYDDSMVNNTNITENDNSFSSNELLKNKIKDNLSFEYPYEELSDILAKTSVTAVVHGAEDREYYFNDKPSFLNHDNILPTQKGTAMHKVMQFIDFSENVNVEKEIDRLVEWQYITEQEGKAVDVEKIKSFMHSDLYNRIKNSKFVKREMRFLTEIKAKDIFDVSSAVADEKIIVQGAVDLLFEDDGKIIIVDFKTDRAKNEQQLIDAYSKQLELYAIACEKIFLKPIKDKIIYSFELSKEIKI